MSRITELRRIKNVTQSELARAIGVSVVAVSKWETGKTSPSANSLEKMAVFFNCDKEEIMNWRTDSSENKIRELREKSGMTQREFAVAIGADYATVNRWEKGKTNPSEEYVQKIAKIFDCDPGEIKTPTKNASECAPDEEQLLLSLLNRLPESKRGKVIVLLCRIVENML